MDYIRKLPLLMSLTGALITGMVGHTNKMPNKENIFRMLIVMVIFYVVGYMIRATVFSTLTAVFLKKEEDKKKKIEQLNREKRQEELERKKKAKKDKGLVLDLRTDDESDLTTDDEGFEALPVANLIRKGLNR